MYQDLAKNKASIYQFASYTALISALLIIFTVIFLAISPTPDYQSSLSERLNFIAQHQFNWIIPNLAIFLIFLFQLPLIMGFYFLTRPTHFLNATLSFILGLFSIIICIQNSFFLISAIPKMAKIFITTQDELLKYSIIANFNSWGLIQAHSLNLGQMIFGLTLYGMMGLLFGLSLFKGIKLIRITGGLLILAGFFSSIGFLGYLIDNSIIQIGILVQIFIYFGAYLVMYQMFRHEAFMNKAISEKQN